MLAIVSSFEHIAKLMLALYYRRDIDVYGRQHFFVFIPVPSEQLGIYPLEIKLRWVCLA